MLLFMAEEHVRFREEEKEDKEKSVAWGGGRGLASM